MNLIKPKNLNKGDTIAIIAPSGESILKKLNLQFNILKIKVIRLN